MTKGPGLPSMEGFPGHTGPCSTAISLHCIANADLYVSAALLKCPKHAWHAFLFALPSPSLPPSEGLCKFLSPIIPQACMSLSPRSHLWPSPGRNSSLNLYTAQKSRVQGLWPDSPGSHPGSCTPHSMTAVPQLSHVHNGDIGSFLRFLGG